jgi:small-conductance mechanosensitive channel
MLFAAQTTKVTHNPILDTLSAVGLYLGLVVITLVVTYVASRLASRQLRGALVRAGIPLNASILLARSLWAGIWAVGIMIVLYLLGIGLTPLAALIGVIGLAASLSLQQVLQNLVAGVYLLAERPFQLGDTIAVVGPSGLNHVGRVEDIQMRITQLRSMDDEVILVPNSAIFAGVITNRTVVGGYASRVEVTFPRQTDPGDVRDRLISLVETTEGVLSSQRPQLRVEDVTKDEWTACIVFWTASQTAASDIVWNIAREFPEANVKGNGAT